MFRMGILASGPACAGATPQAAGVRTRVCGAALAATGRETLPARDVRVPGQDGPVSGYVARPGHTGCAGLLAAMNRAYRWRVDSGEA